MFLLLLSYPYLLCLLIMQLYSKMNWAELEVLCLLSCMLTHRLAPGFQAQNCSLHHEEKVKQELEHLEKQGVIKPMDFSDRAALIVPILKKDGSVCICVDYKVTVNQTTKLHCVHTSILARFGSVWCGTARKCVAFTLRDLACKTRQL